MFYNTILNRDEFSALQQLFVKTSVLLRHSYSLARGFLFFLAGISFLVLTACAGGGGGSSGGGSASAFKVELTFSPTASGFVIGNQSGFGNFVSLNITATSGSEVEWRNISIAEFSDDSYDFTRLGEANWTFTIIGTLSDGRQERVEIDFVWDENKEDHEERGGIGSGLDTDGDRRADSVDEDDDGDGRDDIDDNCPLVANPDQNNTDLTGDGGDACDADDDNDGLDDVDEPEGCELNSDCDNDGLDDGDEVAGCVLLADCDSDTIGDEVDACPAGVMSWTSSGANDRDGDGCRDADEDIDDDGDGLIEIATHQELNSVRYALNGNGSRSAANAALDTTGCGGDDGITSCSGYELIANISLATYADDEGGKGWQPLGHDTDGATDGCQGAAFDGTFDGNGWTISDLNISRSTEDCVGLFGHIAEDSEIRNLALRGETVIGRFRVGGLVGDGESVRIVSSSVVIENIRGVLGLGGLVGWGSSAQIHSSSVVAGEVMGFGNVGAVSNRHIGGLVGWGQSVQIYSSSVVADLVTGSANIGGLVGNGNGVRIFSSSATVERINGMGSNVGGLVGLGPSSQMFSSLVVAAEVSGTSAVGGLTATFNSASRVAYSYVVSGSDTRMLSGEGSGTGVASYWDSDTSGRNNGNHGAPQTTSALQTPTGYADIYADWDDDTDIFGDGMIDEPLAVWCDKDNSGNIETEEQIPDNLIWDFGGTNDYPAIRCTPIGPTEWRSWWSLESGKPKLNQTRLTEELNK